jgi:hypothetical protein
MVKRLAIQTLVLTLSVLLLLFLIDGFPRHNLRTSVAQENDASMQDIFQQLMDNEASFFIRFAQPIIGEEDRSWSIPYDYVRDDVIVGRRRLRSVGSDHICVSEQFHGYEDVWCIPYSNIAAVQYNTAD